MTSFDLYYENFLDNIVVRVAWVIRLTDGTERVGRPWASPLVDIADPVFMFHDGRRSCSIPFRLLESAEPRAQA